MKTFKTMLATSLVAAMLSAGSAAFAQDEHKGHHPEGAAPQGAAPAQQPMPGPAGTGTGMGAGMGMGMMGPEQMKQMQDMCARMMGGGMPMMGGGMGKTGAGMGMMGMMGAPGDAASAGQAFAAAKMKAHHQGMMAAPSDDADIDFARNMIASHHADIDLAMVALKFGKDAGARKLAEDTIRTREAEIALLSTWLKGKAQ